MAADFAGKNALITGAGRGIGTEVTVNVYRPGGVDTAMQAWMRAQDPGRIGADTDPLAEEVPQAA